jgi:hypothetical protein
VIPEAAASADQHSYLKGDALAQAMQADHLQWDPSIPALLPFPSVLDMMARDPAWTPAARQRGPDAEFRRDGCRTTDAAARAELRIPPAQQLHQRRLK